MKDNGDQELLAHRLESIEKYYKKHPEMNTPNNQEIPQSCYCPMCAFHRNGTATLHNLQPDINPVDKEWEERFDEHWRPFEERWNLDFNPMRAFIRQTIQEATQRGIAQGRKDMAEEILDNIEHGYSGEWDVALLAKELRKSHLDTSKEQE